MANIRSIKIPILIDNSQLENLIQKNISKIVKSILEIIKEKNPEVKTTVNEILAEIKKGK